MASARAQQFEKSCAAILFVKLVSERKPVWGTKFLPGTFRRQGPAYTAKNGYPFQSWRVRRQVAPARRKGGGSRVGWGRGAASSPGPVRSQTRPGQDTLACGYSRALAHTHARNAHASPADCIERSHIFAGQFLTPQGRTTRSHSCGHHILTRTSRIYNLFPLVLASVSTHSR